MKRAAAIWMYFITPDVLSAKTTPTILGNKHNFVIPK